MYEDMLQVTTIFKGIFLMQNMLSNCNVEKISEYDIWLKLEYLADF